MAVNTHDIFLEIGKKKVFAGGVRWPGWCRPGRDENSAILALLQTGARYARIMEAAQLEFNIPENAGDVRVVERVQGNFTTDFGAPDIPLSSDMEPFDSGELERFRSILKACWHAFDEAVLKAEGKQLRKGPRGGGHDLAGIITHVAGAEPGYLNSLGWKVERIDGEEAKKRVERIRGEMLKGLEAAAAGQIPGLGPRGSRRWLPRFFARRAAWHIIDHAWEIEDRIIG